ncbi:MAG: 2-oxoglutarate and iron-dependent oxygenase domain-containing protein [Candidatus Pelagadaptatus aseana]|uniref:isopenicillin N synthase family dioxygenase n=1 Tax=Candidatus Pelagadaptatus aseana TaxID=3120508 RepID=UPI0039B237AE
MSSTPSHSAFTTLPIVDMTLLFSDNIDDRRQFAKSLDQATRDAGFLYLKGHGINPDLISRLKQETKQYFAQDYETKMHHYIGRSNNHSGYVPQGEEQFYDDSGRTSGDTDPISRPDKTADLKEAYDIGPESSSLMARITSNGCNQWPDNLAFKQAASDYYQAMLDLSRKLFSGFAMALGLAEDHFTASLSKPPSQLRLIHYFDNPNASANDSGIGAHTDYEFFTILLPTSPGLQALNGAGEWVDIPVLDDCFVINIGDMMEVASHGHYMATSHRVRQVKEERYSFPFFASLDYDTRVEPIPALAKKAAGEHQPEQTDSSLVCGDHLLAQTIQTFAYLKKRLANGEIELPDGSRELSSFGQLASAVAE